MLIRFSLLLFLPFSSATGVANFCLSGKVLKNGVYVEEIKEKTFPPGCQCLLSVDCEEPEDVKCRLIKNVAFTCHKGNVSSHGPSSLRLIYNQNNVACPNDDNCYDDLFNELFEMFNFHMQQPGQEKRQERLKYQWSAMVYAVINKDAGGKESVTFNTESDWLLWTLSGVLIIGCGGGIFYVEFVEKKKKEKHQSMEERSAESPNSAFFAGEGSGFQKKTA